MKRFYFYKDIDGYIYYATEEDRKLCYNTRRESFNNLLVQRRLTDINKENTKSNLILEARFLNIDMIAFLELSNDEIRAIPNIIRSLELISRK